jgi:hypothetical protein
MQADAGAAAPAAALPVQSRSTDFTPESLGELAKSPGPEAAGILQAADEDPASVRSCLRRAFPDVEGHAILLLHARFEGADAYVGVFEATGGDSPDRRIALAASVRRCQLLSYATYSI